MEIKETAAIQVLSAGNRTTIPGVRKLAAELTPQIEAEARRIGMRITGPSLFIAKKLPRDAKTVFDHRICLPVEHEGGYAGAFELLHLEPIMVASAVYQGSMRGLFTKGYAPLVAAVENSRHTFSGESREIYHQWNGAGAGYQMVEIQFGLAY